MSDPRPELAQLLGVPIVRVEPADARVAGGGRETGVGRGPGGARAVGVSPERPFGVAARAWRIETADGEVLLAKRAEPAELAWSAALAEETAVAPRVIAARAGWLVAEWIRGVTLDDALQAEHDAPALAAGLLAGVRELEAACERAQLRFTKADSTSPGLGSNDPEFPVPASAHTVSADPILPEMAELRGVPVESIRESVNQAQAGLAWAARHFGVALSHNFSARLEELGALLERSPTTIGPLDVNARNALVEGRRVRFIDFSVVGRDISERRVLLYGTALGAGRRDGRFVTLGAALSGSLSPDGAARLDACDLLQWGAVALRVAAAVVAPESRPGQFVRAVWGEPLRRLTQLRGQLARPLSPLTAALRDPFGG